MERPLETTLSGIQFLVLSYKVFFSPITSRLGWLGTQVAQQYLYKSNRICVCLYGRISLTSEPIWFFLTLKLLVCFKEGVLLLGGGWWVELPIPTKSYLKNYLPNYFFLSGGQSTSFPPHLKVSRGVAVSNSK